MKRIDTSLAIALTMAFVFSPLRVLMRFVEFESIPTNETKM